MQIGESGEYLCLGSEGVVKVDIIQEASYVTVNGRVDVNGILHI